MLALVITFLCAVIAFCVMGMIYEIHNPGSTVFGLHKNKPVYNFISYLSEEDKVNLKMGMPVIKTIHGTRYLIRTPMRDYYEDSRPRVTLTDEDLLVRKADY